MLVEVVVERAGVDLHIGIELLNVLNALGSGDEHHELDVLAAALLHLADGLGSAAAGGEHGIDDQHVALGTGNKLDPSQLQITDISKTYGCPLARVMRKELKARGILHTRVLFSPELPAATEQKETPPPGRRSVPASLTWVPGCGGLMMGGEAVLDLARRAKEEVK